MKIHTLEVGEGLDCEDLLAALSEQVEELEGIILPDMSNHDMRAVYSDDTLELDDVYEHDGAYRLSFIYDWYAHHQCKDGTRGDTAVDEIRFEYEDGKVTFRIEEVEARTTEDEL